MGYGAKLLKGMGYPLMKRLLAISALALIATACGPKESRMTIVECAGSDESEPPTIAQLQKATEKNPDRIEKILLSQDDASDDAYKEEYRGETHFPWLWVIDKKLGLDYVYSSFEEALIPFEASPPSRISDYDTDHESNESRMSEDGKIFFNTFKTWEKNILLGEHAHTTFRVKINLETLKSETRDDGKEPVVEQCIEHKIPESITINFPKGN